MYSSEWQTAGNTELRTVLVRIQWDTQQPNPFSDWIRPYLLGCAPHYYWGSAKRGSWGIKKRERKLICGSHNAFVVIIIARVETKYSTGYSDDKLMGLPLSLSHRDNESGGWTHIHPSSAAAAATVAVANRSHRPCLHAFRLPNSDPHESGLSWKEDKMCINSLGMFIFWEI